MLGNTFLTFLGEHWNFKTPDKSGEDISVSRNLWVFIHDYWHKDYDSLFLEKRQVCRSDRILDDDVMKTALSEEKHYYAKVPSGHYLATEDAQFDNKYLTDVLNIHIIAMMFISMFDFKCWNYISGPDYNLVL